jgi:hypothetical protein
MLTDSQKNDIKSFYSKEFDRDFLISHSIGYVKLGDEQGYLDVQQYDPPETIPNLRVLLKLQGLPEVVRLKEINVDSIPQSVIDAFDRHIWYSRYVLTDIRIVKFNVSGIDTFGVYSESYSDDGWSSSLISWEIYLLNGELLGSLISEKPDWLDRTINYNDFDLIVPPPYNPGEIRDPLSPIFVKENCYEWILPLWSKSNVVLVK